MLLFPVLTFLKLSQNTKQYKSIGNFITVPRQIFAPVPSQDLYFQSYVMVSFFVVGVQ
jgi:hypothetical protein